MRLSVLTLFPDLIRQVIGSSITGRALEKGIFSLDVIQIRDFAVNDYGKADDYCYGGGTGMLMMAQPILDAWLHAVKLNHQDAPEADAASVIAWREKHRQDCRTFYLSPRGDVYSQSMASELSQYEHLIFLCGHYEGVDQRVLDLVTDAELSIGDYVLTGGELGACVVIDGLLRMVPGVLPNSEAYGRESHMNQLLEHAQYTRPAVWQNINVPDVLLSGHQARIDAWKHRQSLYETARRRPDLLQRRHTTSDEWQGLLENWPEKQ